MVSGWSSRWFNKISIQNPPCVYILHHPTSIILQSNEGRDEKQLRFLIVYFSPMINFICRDPYQKIQECDAKYIAKYFVNECQTKWRLGVTDGLHKLLLFVCTSFSMTSELMVMKRFNGENPNCGNRICYYTFGWIQWYKIQELSKTLNTSYSNSVT